MFVVKMRSCWTKMGPDPVTGVPYRKTSRTGDAQRETQAGRPGRPRAWRLEQGRRDPVWRHGVLHLPGSGASIPCWGQLFSWQVQNLCL